MANLAAKKLRLDGRRMINNIIRLHLYYFSVFNFQNLDIICFFLEGTLSIFSVFGGEEETQYIGTFLLKMISLMLYLISHLTYCNAGSRAGAQSLRESLLLFPAPQSSVELLMIPQVSMNSTQALCSNIQDFRRKL